MKKIILVLVVLLSAASVFVGCKKTGGGDGALKVAIWDQNQASGIRTVLEDFTRETGIGATIEVTPWNDYWNLLEAAATGGSLPDVFWMHSNQAVRYMRGGQLMDLTGRIAGSGVDLSNFPADLVGIYTYNGKNYGIPKDLDTIAVAYNKKLFDAAGVPYPEDNWNWDDMKEAARKLTNPAKGQYGIGWSPGETQTGYWNEIFQNGGYVISPDKKKSGYDDPNTIAAVEYVVSYVKEGLSPDLEHMESSLDSLLQAEVIAMAQFGSWVLSSFNQNDYLRENIDWVMLPAGPTGKRATIFNGLGWSAAASSKNSDRAWKLLEFLAREDTQKKLSRLGVAISAYKGASDPFAQGFPAYNVKAFLDQIPYAVGRPWSLNTPVWEDMAGRNMNEAWAGAKPVADICRTIASQMNTALAEE